MEEFPINYREFGDRNVKNDKNKARTIGQVNN